MKTPAHIATLAAAALALCGCSNAPEVWQPESAPLCGLWTCTVRQGQSILEAGAEVITTSTAANDNTILVQYASRSYRCDGDIAGLGFAGPQVEGGRIFKDAVMVKPIELNGGPIPADSIDFVLHRDGAPDLQFSGHRFTGWETYIQ